MSGSFISVFTGFVYRFCLAPFRRRTGETLKQPSLGDDLTRLLKTANSNPSSISPNERTKVLAACRGLCASLESPVEALFKLMFGPHQITAVRVAMEMGVFQVLASLKGRSICLKELANITNVDPLLLLRTLRVLVASGVVREVGIEIYASGPVGGLLVVPELYNAVSLIFDEHTAVLPSLPAYLASTSFRNPDDTHSGPFQHAFNTPLAFFDWLETRPDRLAVFNSAMAGQRAGRGQDWFQYANVPSLLLNRRRRSAASPCRKGAAVSPSPTESLTRLCEVKEIPNSDMDDREVLVVDVGGGVGHDLLAFHTQFPHLFYPPHNLRLVLQDLEATIASIPTTGVNHAAQTLPPPAQLTNPHPDIAIQVHDFFTTQPILNARAYYFRTIFHDWPDMESRAILGHTARAMNLESKILINEYVLPEMGVGLFPACLDLSMMATKSALERTESQWRDLVEGVEWEEIGSEEHGSEDGRMQRTARLKLENVIRQGGADEDGGALLESLIVVGKILV